MIQTNTIGSFTEIYVGGGNFITQSGPTYFHTFSTRKILAGDEKIEDFMEVTPAQQANILEHDASFVRPPRLFIAQWNAACGKYGRYNPDTGYFELNGLTDITYEEALLIMRYPLYTSYDYRGYLFNTISAPLRRRVRTNMCLATVATGPVDCQNMFNRCGIEVIRIPDGMSVSNIDGMLVNNNELIRVIGSINMSSYVRGNFCSTRSQCRELWLKYLSKSLNLGAFYNLELECWQYMLKNAINTSAITITVHPDIYAKLTGDTTNAAAAALTEEELAQWQQLLVDAAEKQITFATT